MPLKQSKELFIEKVNELKSSYLALIEEESECEKITGQNFKLTSKYLNFYKQVFNQSKNLNKYTDQKLNECIKLIKQMNGYIQIDTICVHNFMINYDPEVEYKKFPDTIFSDGQRTLTVRF